MRAGGVLSTGEQAVGSRPAMPAVVVWAGPRPGGQSRTQGLAVTDGSVALPSQPPRSFGRVLRDDTSADELLTSSQLYNTLSAVAARGADATVLNVGHRGSAPTWSHGMEGSGSKRRGLVPAALRLLLQLAAGHRKALQRAARSSAVRKPGQQQAKLNPSVEPLLLEQLWSAIHSKRQLFGRVVQDISSFFAAADRDDKGSVGLVCATQSSGCVCSVGPFLRDCLCLQADLRRAMQRLDVGLSSAQITRLLATIDTDKSGAIEEEELAEWMERSRAAAPDGHGTAEATADGYGATVPAAEASLDSAGVGLRLRWFAIDAGEEITDLLTGEGGLCLRKRPDRRGLASSGVSEIEVEGLSYVEPRDLSELEELDDLRRHVSETLPRTSHLFVTVTARLDGVGGGQQESGRLTFVSLGELPAGAMYTTRKDGEGRPRWLVALQQLLGSDGGRAREPRPTSKVTSLLRSAVAGEQSCVVLAHIGLRGEDLPLSDDTLQLGTLLQSPQPAAGIHDRPNPAPREARVVEKQQPKETTSTARLRVIRPQRSVAIRNHSADSDAQVQDKENRDEEAAAVPSKSSGHTGRRAALSMAVNDAKTKAKPRPKSAPRERTQKRRDREPVAAAAAAAPRRGAATDHRRAVAQALLDQQFSPQRDAARNTAVYSDYGSSGDGAGGSSAAQSIAAVKEAEARTDRAQAETARVKKELAAAMKRCANSERAHGAVDASLQCVHGQVAELGQERKAMQGDLRRLNNRYVALATAHAKLQAETQQDKDVVHQEVPSADDDPLPEVRASTEDALTVAKRKVTNRHAKQELVPVPSLSQRAREAKQRSHAAAKATTEMKAEDGGPVMTVSEQRLCRQRLAQATRTISKLKARTAKQSANQSALATSLEEVVAENNALRQALAQVAEHQPPPPPQRQRSPTPPPEPPTRSTSAVRGGAAYVDAAWAAEQTTQMAAAAAGLPLSPPGSPYGDDEYVYDDGDEAERSAAADEMDVEMREYLCRPFIVLM